MKTRGLVDRLIGIIHEDHNEREKAQFNEILRLKNKLADIEDDVMYRYAPDWFRCEGCNTVKHMDHINCDLANTTNQTVCYTCAPEKE